MIFRRFRPVVVLFLALLAWEGAQAQTVECAWSPPVGDSYPNAVHVTGTVTVANLSDDNGDGETNSLDVPDLVFPSTSAPHSSTDPAVIRVVDGRCNDDGTMTTLTSFQDIALLEQVDATSAIAVGNLDPAIATTERAPELVVTLQGGKIAAVARLSADATSWETRWISAEGVDQGAGVQPSIADLDADGSPEVIAGKAVFNGQTGALIWSGTGGKGADSFGAVSTVVDWDLNGEQDVATGQTIFDNSGTLLIDFQIADGYTAVGNFNADAFPELVHIAGGVVRVFDLIGTELFTVAVPGGGRGGPPTIADYDGDGEAEICIVAQYSVSVLDFDCLTDPLPAECQSTGVRWSNAIQEFTSGGQSSGAFDLDGDGAAEIFFVDEAFVRVLSGSEGVALYSQALPAMVTWFQYPTFADIDSDGQGELVIPIAVSSGEPTSGGVQILSSPDWQRARGSWNQYSYNITNIDDAGQIPATPAHNWQSSKLNSFRANSVVKPDLLFANGFE